VGGKGRKEGRLVKRKPRASPDRNQTGRLRRGFGGKPLLQVGGEHNKRKERKEIFYLL